MGTRHFELRTADDFGLTIEEARLESGLTQAELADKTPGLSRTGVARMESPGAVEYVERFLALCRSLGVTVEARMNTDR